MLSPLADLFDPARTPDILVGLGVPDDAAVFRVNARTAVVATLDFFAPLVDDPWTYGAIAAANAMSDVFAMGGEVVLALNIAAFPEDLPATELAAILRGGADKVIEAGGVIAGGHTVWDEEPKYGLSVLGLAHPGRLFKKAGLRPGDQVYLTKPIGTGVLVSGRRAGHTKPAWLDAACESMLRLNRHAAHIAQSHRVRAATDVTGFGLLGHLWEMAERSGVSVTVEAGLVPLLEGAREVSGAGVHTGGEGRNRDWAGPHVEFGSGVDAGVASLLFDPQTSGGLLIGVPRRRAAAFEGAFAADGEQLWRIGEAGRGPAKIAVR